MRNVFRLSALMLVAMLAIIGSRGASSVAAQDDPMSGFGADFSEYEGIQEGAGRSYMPDYEVLMSTPENLESLDSMTGNQLASFGVFRFDTDDNAEAAVADLRSQAESEMVEETEGTTVETIDHDDIDDDAVAYKVTMTDDTLGSTTTVIVVEQEDEYVYLALIVAVGEDQDPTDLAVTVVNDMEDADAGEGEGTFNADGTSEGGLWDKLPKADSQDGAFEGLTIADSQLYPTDGTPAS